MFYEFVFLSWLAVIIGLALFGYWVMKIRPWDRSAHDVASEVPPVVGLNERGEPIYYPSLEQEPLLTEPDSEARLAELYRKGEIDEDTYNRLIGEYRTRRSA